MSEMQVTLPGNLALHVEYVPPVPGKPHSLPGVRVVVRDREREQLLGFTREYMPEHHRGRAEGCLVLEALGAGLLKIVEGLLVGQTGDVEAVPPTAMLALWEARFWQMYHHLVDAPLARADAVQLVDRLLLEDFGYMEGMTCKPE